MELSFKVHQCGGALQCVPCSRVSHVFRDKTKTLNLGYLAGDALTCNRKRVAAVWLDDLHREIMAIAAPGEKVDIGDISKPLQVRKNMQCKSFAWYLSTKYPELYVPDLSTGQYGALRWKGCRRCTRCFLVSRQSWQPSVYNEHGWKIAASGWIRRFCFLCEPWCRGGESG